MKRLQRTAGEWSILFAKQAAGGQSRNRWCAENGIKPRTMEQAKRRLTARGAAGWVAVSIGATGGPAPTIETHSSRCAGDGMSLHVEESLTIRCGRIEVDLPGGCGSETFAMIVRGLANLC